MKHAFVAVPVAAGVVCLSVLGLRAQTAQPFIAEAKQLYSIVKNNAGQMVRLGQSTRERSKLGLLFGMTSHANEQYGYMAVYLRLKGLVPPSSDPQ